MGWTIYHGESMHIHWLGLLCPFKMDFPAVKHDHEKTKPQVTYT